MTQLRLICDGQDYSSAAAGLTFSNTDPGGYEACSFTLPYASRIRKGRRLEVQAGTARAWYGRVGERDPNQDGDHASLTVAGEGYRAILEAISRRMVFVNRAIGQWTDAPITRQQTIAAGGSFGAVPLQADETGLSFAPSSGQALANAEDTEAWYQAPPGVTIAKLIYRGQQAGTWTSFEAATLVAAAAFVTQESYGLTLDNTIRTQLLTTLRDELRLRSFTTAPVTAGAGMLRTYDILATYGNHGLATRPVAGDADGLYPSDIAGWAIQQAHGQIVPGVLELASLFTVMQSVYSDRASLGQMIDDMANTIGWHWGVWEPLSMFDNTPRADFRAPPSTATCFVSGQDCQGLAFADRLAGLANLAVVSYTDTAGASHELQISQSVPDLDDVGLTQELRLDAGVTTAAAAAAYAQLTLAATNRGARAAGSCTLPGDIRIPGGASRPSCLTKSGLDRIKLVDMTSGQLFDTSGLDTFRISRAETTVDDQGQPATRIEFDDGQNLASVLQAQLATLAPV